MTPYFTGGAHGVERTGDKLRSTGALPVVGRFRFEELGVRENDSELVIQLVKEQPQIDRLIHRDYLAAVGRCVGAPPWEPS